MRKIILKILVLVFLLSSCVEETEIILQGDLDERLVVDVKLTNDTTYQIAILSKTIQYYTEEQTPRAVGATVKIISGSGEVFLFEEIEPGIYQTTEKVYGEIGESYLLQIDYDGKKHEASSEIRRSPVVDSIAFRWEPFMESFRVLYFGMEPAGKGDNYLYHIYKNGVLMTDSLKNITFTNDDFIDGIYIFGFEVDAWFNKFNLQQGDTVTLEVHSIPKDAYAYILEIFFETGGAGPMGGSGKTPRGNISNDAFGLFYGASIVRTTRVIE
ncbi:MAG: DUF4249 domain-containing protein [Bacteroidetes bacterium]|nr:DUF4249 domain-containing protein [Bacteroidota bacterium]